MCQKIGIYSSEGTFVREAGVHRIEVHVAAAAMRRTNGQAELLALHRAWTRTLFPGYWEGIGGQVSPGESLEAAVLRHLSDEAGLVGTVVCPFDTYVIDPGPHSGADELIPGIRFLVRLDAGVDPTVDPQQHQGWRWVPVQRLAEVHWIPGMLPQLLRAVDLFETERDQRD